MTLGHFIQNAARKLFINDDVMLRMRTGLVTVNNALHAHCVQVSHSQ